MEINKRNAVNDKLSKYDVLAKEDDYIEVTEWTNGEGWDIDVNEKKFSISFGELEAINFLTKYLDINRK